MLEKDITAKIMKYLKTLPMCFTWKQHGASYSRSGLPDIICCYDGSFVAFEVKQPCGRLSKLQEITLRKIADAGGIAHKVTSLEEVKEIVAELDEQLNIGHEYRGDKE